MPFLARLLIAPTLVAGLVASTRDAEASCIPGFDYAAFGKNQVTWGGGATTDSYSSAGTSTYASSHTSADGNIGTNGDQCSVIDFNGTAGGVNGNVEYGSTGSSCSVDGANYTGSAYPQGTEPAFPSVVVPSSPSCAGAVNKSCTTSSGCNLAPGCYKDVSTKYVTNISTGTYIMSSFSMTSNNSGLNVSSGPITIYITCTGSTTTGIDMTGNGVSNPSLKSTDLIFLVASTCTSISITGGTDASFAVYAPDSNVTITGGSDLYGAVVGKTIDATGGAQIHYDRALHDTPVGQFSCTSSEISRASPVSATIGGSTYVVQGTYEYPFGSRQTLTPTNASTWKFQFIKGHLRRQSVSSIGTTASLFSTTFDMAVPTRTYTGCTATDGSCRRIFTNTNTTGTGGVTWRTSLGITQLKDGTSSTVGPLITAGLKSTYTWTSANYQSIVRAVLDAPLGGIDRATVAVIGASPLAGRTDRPTVAYFGGTDGMLHAVCMSTGKDASGNATCSTVGNELWAFMPRVQLPLVGSNATRIDGSVHVIDANGDFTNQTMTGTKSYRTILVFQTGYANALAKAAAYAVDVTDPANPVFLWEYTTPTSPAAIDFGQGLTSTPGVALISSKNTNFVAFTTNNGGTGTSGIFITARQLETGAQLWTTTTSSPWAIYPTADAVPSTALPGGAVAVDLTSSNTITDLIMGDIDGRLWRIKSSDGSNVFGTNPLFKFSSIKHPIGAKPAIYSNNNTQYAVFASGGYVDYSGTTSYAASTQYVIGVKLTSTSTKPITETASACSNTCDLHVKQSFTGSLGYSQVSIVGTTLQVLSDTSDVNAANYGTTADTGRLLSFDLTQNTPTDTVADTTYSGGTSLVVIKGTGTATAVSSSGTKQQVVASGISTSGTSVDVVASATALARRLWLRME